jgi:hypothetical protein
MPMPSQAIAPKRAVEGVTTRGRAKAVMPPRAPCPFNLNGDEIVCSYVKDKRKKHRIKSRCDNIRTTIQARSGKLADDFTNNNALLRNLRKRGNVRPVSGGNVILEEIAYTDSTSINANSYSGYEVLNITPNSPISAAQFNYAQYASAVTISGLETLQNAGEAAIIDLLEGRIKVAEGQLMNRLDYDLYLDGTGNAGKNVVGLAAAVADTPTGTYGGIVRTSFTFWKNQTYSGVTNGGAAVSAANIQAYMTSLGLSCVRGSDMPDTWIGDSTYFAYYVNSLQAIQRITDNPGSGDVGAGFGPALKFYGGGTNANVYMGGGISGAVSGTQLTSGATASHMWALNTSYLFLRPHSARNFVPIGGDRQSVNQDAIVKLIGWAGAMTSSGPQFCGVLTA